MSAMIVRWSVASAIWVKSQTILWVSTREWLSRTSFNRDRACWLDSRCNNNSNMAMGILIVYRIKWWCRWAARKANRIFHSHQYRVSINRCSSRHTTNTCQVARAVISMLLRSRLRHIKFTDSDYLHWLAILRTHSAIKPQITSICIQW